ncbi:unnamed protein product [Hymenolepis diminuta]|uniref:DUF5727 domain-containing protein n=1 Tax=Hymenolepis diminuta TaxID=6216 RepID=A0A564Y4G9_HYMDI|nr:unnamed protein product [Hymenolepis diminuta]
MIQVALIFMCYFSLTFAGSGEVLGSRVITNFSGKVGPMYFKWTNASVCSQSMTLCRILSAERDGTTLRNGSFGLGTCELLPDRTIITFNEVPDYDLLILQKKSEEYTVYFAKDCKFPDIYVGKLTTFDFAL